MVLEDATSPESTFSESPPSSDIDPYSSDRDPGSLSTTSPSYLAVGQASGQQIYVNLNSLPRRFSLVGPANHPKPLLSAIQDTCKVATEMMGRPIRQEEADALAYHFARSVRISSYGTPVGLFLAGIQWRRTRETYRFPGWTPGKKFNPDVFGPLRAERARLAWHMLRFSAYGVLGSVLGQIFFGSYALTVGSAGRLLDPRLKEFTDAIKAKVRAQRSNGVLPGGREVDTTAGPREGETLDMARQRQRAQETFKKDRQASGGTKKDVDDTSPTGGAFETDFLETPNQTSSDVMSDGQVQNAESRNSREQHQRVPGDLEQHNKQPLPTVRKETTRDPDARDSSPAAQAESAPNSKPGSSAWERLRQQGSAQSSSKSSQASPRSRDASSSDDSFIFNSGLEDRQLARSEAQKQFDTRVERERAGKNFED